MYFCTFTCYQWLNLFEITNGYDLVYKWFSYLKTKKQAEVVAYVIMPNHVHCILYFGDDKFNLNKIISNAKRFIAYDIVKRLKQLGLQEILYKLQDGLSTRDQDKGQKHKVFEVSFDAKAIYSELFFYQKFDYIHYNPVNGKWQLVTDFTAYEHSSASFYELGVAKHFEPKHYAALG